VAVHACGNQRKLVGLAEHDFTRQDAPLNVCLAPGTDRHRMAKTRLNSTAGRLRETAQLTANGP
jgi:hypothetical protein